MEIITNSPRDTKKYAKLLGKKLLHSKKLIFIVLTGDLGGGKTTFVQGLAKGIGVEETVTSPTFLIFKKYTAKQEKTLYHFDAYRIKGEDLSVLRFDELLHNKKNIIIVEWGERIKKFWPKEAIEIKFYFEGIKKRRLIIRDDSGIMTDV